METESNNIRIATPVDIERIVQQYPHTVQVICKGEDTFTLVVEKDSEFVAFASSFVREIPAPVDNRRECFINVIDVFDIALHGKGIGSGLVQMIIRVEAEMNCIQVRAYCEIDNIASHRLWLKNGFGISPMKHMDGSISGSFVTYRI